MTYSVTLISVMEIKETRIHNKFIQTSDLSCLRFYDLALNVCRLIPVSICEIPLLLNIILEVLATGVRQQK